MPNYSTAAIVVSAVITTDPTTPGGKPTVNPVNVGDTLTNLVLARPCGQDRTIASAKVLGFKVASREIRRPSAEIIDNVPTMLYDEDGHHFGTAEETLCVKEILIEVAPAEGTAKTASAQSDPTAGEYPAKNPVETLVIQVRDIKSVSVTAATKDTATEP